MNEKLVTDGCCLVYHQLLLPAMAASFTTSDGDSTNTMPVITSYFTQ
jgi:hypothetical protein